MKEYTFTPKALDRLIPLRKSNYMDIGSSPDWIKMVDVDHDGIKELIIEGGFGTGGGNCCYDFNGFKFNSSGKMERFLFSGW